MVWRQDHNGFSHQDPGFIDHVMNKKAEIVRVLSSLRMRTRLLSVVDHCLRSRNYVNVIWAGKQPEPQWLDMEEAHQALCGARRERMEMGEHCPRSFSFSGRSVMACRWRCAPRFENPGRGHVAANAYTTRSFESAS